MSWSYVSTGSTFEERGGYSRALYDDEWVFVSGTTGFDYTSMTIADDFEEQVRQTWKNIAHALAEAGSDLSEVVSFLIVLADRADYPALLEVPTGLPHRPAGTLIVADLVDPRMKVEIQVTAKRRRGG